MIHPILAIHASNHPICHGFPQKTPLDSSEIADWMLHDVHERPGTIPRFTGSGYWPPGAADAEACWWTDTTGRRFLRTRDVVEVRPGDLLR